MRIINKNDTVEFLFENTLDYSLYKNIDEVISLSRNGVSQVYLDFSNTKFITLPSCIYIIYLLHEIKIWNNYFETKILSISEGVLAILTKFGFFDISTFYCNLKIDKKIEPLINIEKRKKSSSIYWPISTVPPKVDRDFDSSNITFIQEYSKYFDLLVKNNLIVSNEFLVNDIRSLFTKTIYELIKNIWDHSESWGLSSIQSTKNTGTTICICDYGIGFIESYKNRNTEYLEDETNNRNLIESQLEDNFSSKSKFKYGHGLWRVKQFVDMIEGTMLIKTANYKIIYDGKLKKQTISADSFFKGAQIFINFKND